MPVTHQQIAEKLGVSRSVVTLALHRTRGARINEQTRREILDVARQLGYQPRTMTTHTIGYALPVEELGLLGESSFLTRIETALRGHGFRPVLVDLNADARQLQELLNPKTVDGVLFSRWQEGRIVNLLSSEVPWVLMSDESSGLDDMDLVTADLRETIFKLTEYLASHRHERICLLTGSLDVAFHRRMWDALQDAFEEKSLPVSGASVISGVDSLIEGELLKLLESELPPTSFIAASPEKSVTLLNLLSRNGYRVPEDISVVSLFDLPMFQSLRPLLTATTAMGANVAEQAVTRLIEKIAQPASPTKQIRVPGDIIERDSVRMLN